MRSNILDGTYVMTADTVYTGPGGSSGPSTTQHVSALRVSGDEIEMVRDDVLNATGTFTVEGTTLTITGTCPEGFGAVVEFSAQGRDLMFFDDNNVDTYTRQ